MPRYRTKPVVIEATRLAYPTEVTTLEGIIKGNPGDWLIVGVKGERYICKHDIFVRTYEPVDEIAEEELDRVISAEV